MKKVLILTSIKTGSGHRSSSNAIEKKLKDAGYDTRQLDVFPLMGRLGRFMENSYIPLTTKAPYAYYLMERGSEHFPFVVHSQMYYRVRKQLLKKIREYDPDLIISVQCMFTKAISHIIRRYKLNIPFYIGIIDLVDPPAVWQDKNADMSFVPTQAVADDLIAKGFDPKKVLVSGFPVRDDIVVRDTPKTIDDKARILMVNSSTSLHKNIRFVQEVSRLQNVSIDFICGLDEKLYNTLSAMKKRGELDDRIRIHSFVSNMNEFMNEAHVILTKAGPNVIVEAVRSGTAIVITGHIHGQEDNNHKYVLANGYGIVCEDPNQIYDELNDFIHSGKLKKCLENITRHGIDNGAEFIADYVINNIGI
ncbi:MAG: glycosyltransferase [Erysipelotrichaceae bacterium]|nr:glycosyltransferase [Erysipelotrichaceae bacterium]